ncbi:hypothetical protein IAU60_003515 [Kwoniella sp. DSM 27419]
MKVPTDRHSSDAAYAPYNVPSPTRLPGPSPSSVPRKVNGGRPSAPPTLASIGSTGSDDASQPQYKVARAISSCTRCRSRKQKCDGKLPACSACERAKVECIGFDAISKTNVSRNYLHSLEQEVATLRAQVEALQSGEPLPRKHHAPISVPHSAPSLRTDFPLDPALAGEDGQLRSPLESPSLTHAYGQGYGHTRRHSDYPLPATPMSLDSPRSPFTSGLRGPAMGQTPGIHATSLTRMVHDAALRTGHAIHPGSSMNPPGSNASGSEKGSSVQGVDSPVATLADVDCQTSPDGIPTPRRAGLALPGPSASRRRPSSSPLAATSALLGSMSGPVKVKRRTFAIPPLPPQPAVERLVAAYVDFVGVTAPIIHIPSLGKQLMKMREGTDVEESDVFVVMMVLALSTMASSRFVDPPDELRACSETFHAEAMKHLDAVFEEQSYVGLQAILLLVWYSLLNPDKGSIWFLVGLATRTCVDLGYHNEHNAQVEQLDVLELDMRRRLFWCTYKMDRLLSLSLGRPPSIPDGFINVPLSSAMHDIDIHPGDREIVGEPCSYKAVFLHTTKLRQLQSEILFQTYGVHGTTGRLPSEEWRLDCFDRLKTWLATAPEPRGTVSTEGYAISFHNSCLLLFRPSPGCPRPGRNALATVLTSSSYVIRIYRRMQLNNRISWLWMTSHFSFMAGLSFLYAYFNLYSMGGGKDVPNIEDAMMVTESCLGVLEFLAPRVPSASACHDTMRSLCQAIFDQLTKLDAPPTAGSTATSPGRGILRGAPISSSREDPLPNEAFPAPLPAVALPYELSLLDNLFRNPMASHNKASEYTSNQKCQKKKVNVDYGGNGNYSPAPPRGYPPGAFHTAGNDDARRRHDNGHREGHARDEDGERERDREREREREREYTAVPSGGPGLYHSASVLGSSAASPFSLFQQGNPTSFDQPAQQQPLPQVQASGGGEGEGEGGGDRVLPMLNGAGAEGDPNGFDLFSFLMDEEGLGGTYPTDLPTDFTLWS